MTVDDSSHQQRAKLLANWAAAQLAPWRDLVFNDQEFLSQRLDALAGSSPMVFLYDFSYNYVSVRSKDETVLALDDPLAPELLRRANLYRGFFQQVLTRFGARHRFTLAVDVDDHPTEYPDVPVFAFQKHRDSRLVLLPDVDLLSFEFFNDLEYLDETMFEQKTRLAVFVGATTGGHITDAVVDNLSLPRLRAAMFFRDSSEVSFTLPKIVQCDSAATEDRLRALGVSGEKISWRDQFKARHLISMDGNGATCSRVAIALHSRSVLLKYDSPYQLYYFAGLEQGEHFIPICSDQDVIDFLADERERPGLSRNVAESGRLFARRYLSRPSVAAYVAHLLDGYGEMVGATGGRAADEGSFIVDTYGHVENLGDVWSDAGAWLGSVSNNAAIEGFGLEAGSELDAEDLACRAVLDDGALSPVCSGRTFCGTRGERRPLRGLQVWLTGKAASTFELGCEAVFKDGQHVGPVWDGSPCRSAAGAELVALRVLARRR